VRESELIQHIYAANPKLPNTITIPPGDDMAAITLPSNELLVTTDQLAQGTHFIPGTPIRKIARKALARSLSDAAAMAVIPVAAVAAASLPRSTTPEQATELIDALQHTAAAYNCPLIGGDIGIWDHPMLITTTVLAQPAAGTKPVTRSGAQPGDTVCVTGSLGGSAHTINGYTHHLDFEPRIDLARALATFPGLSIHCMIDLSDGLAIDLAHLCRAAQPAPLATTLEADQLPISQAAFALAKQTAKPPWPPLIQHSAAAAG